MKVENISKVYDIKGGEKVNALAGVSFDLPASGMVIILGKSGSGKTTLLNILGGLDRFDGGDIVCFGKHMKDFSGKELDHYRNSCCGFVFQEYNLIPELNVGDNIALALQLQGQKETDKKIKSVLKQVELAGYENRKIRELSGGQKQRVAIARALVKDPKIILADEPTGALDSHTGESIFQILKAVAKEKLVVVVTHDKDLAEKYADRIIELSDGVVKRDSDASYRSTEETKGIEMRSSRMSIKAALKIGCSNFRYHPLRLVSTVVLSVIAFVLLGVFLITGTVNYSDFIYDSLQANRVSACVLKKYENEMLSRFSGEDRAAIEEQFNRNTISVKNKVLKLDGYSENGDLPASALPDKIVQISEKNSESFHMEYHGQLPATDGEIAITDLLAEAICGSEDAGGSIENCVGKKLTVNGKEYTITALIDTKTEEESDASKAPAKEVSRFLQNALFVCDIDLFEEEGEITFDYPGDLYLKENDSVEISRIVKDTDSIEKYPLGEETSGYYLPIGMMPIVLNSISCVIEYQNAVYHNYGDLFRELIGNEQEDEDLQEKYVETFDRIRREFALEAHFSFTLRNDLYHISDSFSIDGFYYQENPSYKDPLQELVIRESSFEEIRHRIDGQCDAIIVPLEAGLNEYFSHDSMIRADNSIVSKLFSLEGNLLVLKNISFVSAIVLTVFSSMLIVSFMSQSMSDKTKTIGILKAFGSNNFNIIQIFIWEGLIIGLCVFLVAQTSLAGVCKVLNSLLSRSMNFYLRFFDLHGFVTVCLLFFTTAFSLLGCLIPMIRLSRLEPNEIMKYDE